jgi:site-specific DNA-methyltransferase (adenine-specific)
MEPYFADDRVTLYHGDCRDVLPQLDGRQDTIITDPVWPGASLSMPGSGHDDEENPQDLLADALALAPESTRRVALHLGTSSDPRFLEAVPARFPFFRTARLDLSFPSYRGRLLYSCDTAYLFGQAPPSRDDQHLIPGYCSSDGTTGNETDHPAGRKIHHVRWLVKWWSAPGDTILDPFAGTATTLAAAAYFNRDAVGIEINERFCELAAEQRLSQPAFAFD